MPKYRILIVDDSATMRRLVAKSLECDPDLEVAGYAPNGKIGIQKIPQLNPDVVTLDVEMPVMDGLEALAEIRKTYPRLPVIMFSTLTHRGASTTLEALFLGASDYVAKPEQVKDFRDGIQQVQSCLIPKIKALCGGAETEVPRTSIQGKPITRKRRHPGLERYRKRIEILAIGVSTGGPNALAEIIPDLPMDFPVPIVIVQHMPPVFTGFLAESLNKNAQIEVHEARKGQVLKPGVAWIAPGNFHMIVEGKRAFPKIGLNQNEPENSCRPAVDVLFRSVADVFGGNALGVVLTGMGKDGLRGALQIHDKGGRIFAQDEATSVVWGMPGFVAQSGIAEKVLPINEIASAINSAVKLNASRIPRVMPVA